MEIYFSLLVAILGALLWLVSSNWNLRIVGIVAYGAGLLAFLFQAAGAHFGIMGH